MAATDLVSFKDRKIDQLGNIIVTADQFTTACLAGKIINDQVFVDKMTNDIKQYNRYAEQKVSVYDPTDISIPDEAYQWTFPQQYQQIKLSKYVSQKLVDLVDADMLTEHQLNERITRVQDELTLIKKHGLTKLFQCLIYIIDRLTAQNTVWGVGRGSSVASYVLYLIGVHDVDSVKYDIDPLEFFKTR
jgi:DNA polymerase III alpha subunit